MCCIKMTLPQSGDIIVTGYVARGLLPALPKTPLYRCNFKTSPWVQLVRYVTNFFWPDRFSNWCGFQNTARSDVDHGQRESLRRRTKRPDACSAATAGGASAGSEPAARTRANSSALLAGLCGKQNGRWG